MQIAIVRHAKAEPRSPSGRDEDRALAPRGRTQSRFLAEALASHEIPFDAVLTSRAVRARETAEPIAESLGVEARETDALFIDRPVSGIVDLLESLDAELVPVLVGHEPVVSGLLSFLVDGGYTDPFASHAFKTGQCVLVDLSSIGPGGGAVLESFRSDA